MRRYRWTSIHRYPLFVRTVCSYYRRQRCRFETRLSFFFSQRFPWIYTRNNANNVTCRIILQVITNSFGAQTIILIRCNKLFSQIAVVCPYRSTVGALVRFISTTVTFRMGKFSRLDRTTRALYPFSIHAKFSLCFGTFRRDFIVIAEIV